MFPDLSGSNTPPFHNSNLRRRRQARQDVTFHYNGLFDCPFSGFGDVDGTLDLSMHRPRLPSNNRFSALAIPPPTLPRDREYAASAHNRRSRHNRGTREAKKRRDLRRNRRKFAAQLLDEQLSRGIDQALTTHRLPPVPAINTSPDPPKVNITFPWPSWAESPPTPPQPSPPPLLPQLPLLDFGNFDFGEFPCIAPGKPHLPLTSPSTLSTVPRWCPYIPALMATGAGWNGEVPRFTDLSGLPEPMEPRKFDSVQQNRAKVGTVLKKQSRFFPTLTTSVSSPIVRLPPTSCKLYRTEEAVTYPPVPETWTNPDNRPSPSCPARYVNTESSLDTESVQPEKSVEHVLEQSASGIASAANLWRILSEDGILTAERIKDDECRADNLRSTWESSEDSGGVPIYEATAQPSMPELDSKEIPYVHLNSLTGHANETGGYHSVADHDTVESVLYPAVFFATPRSITPSYELTATAPRYTPSSPSLHMLEAGSLCTLDQAIIKARPEISDEMKKSVDHFSSEQDLFRPEQVQLPISRPRTPCGLDAFLAMGHVENCWCRDCNETPEMIQKDEIHDDDDDWLDWSTLGDEIDNVSTNTVPQTATVSDVSDEEEHKSSCFPGTSTPEWDELYPCTSGQEESQQEFEDEFLGYYDDGAAFARVSDCNWTWTDC